MIPTQALCNCMDTFSSIGYEAMAPILEAGYRSSLIDLPDGLETAHFDVLESTHFSVIKKRHEYESAQPFLRSFYSRWRFVFPQRLPTVVILSIKQEITQIDLSADAVTKRILREMTGAAQEHDLSAFGIGCCAEVMPGVEDLYTGLHIPRIFVPAGIIGFAVRKQNW